MVLPLLTWNSLDEITFMERNLKKVCILYNVSQNSISGVTLVYTDQNKVCIWYFIIKSRKNSDLFWFFSKMMKSHQKVIISRSELRERGILSKTYFNSIKIEWILNLNQDTKKIWPQVWGQGRKEDQILTLKMMVSTNSLLCLKIWHYDAII